MAALLFGASTVLCFACDDDTGGDLRVHEGKIALDPPRLNFGLVQVNTETGAKIVIKNIGDGVLTIGKIQEQMGDDVLIRFDCEPDACENRLIPSSGSAVLHVYFKPTQFGEHKSSLEVIPDAKSLDSEILEITGEGVTATIDLSPRNIDFGNVVVETTKSLSIQVTNNSPIAADVHYSAGNNIMYCGSTTDNPTPFCIAPTTKNFSSDDRFNLKPGESTRLNLQYRPSPNASLERADFALKACATCDVVPVSVSGQGVLTGFQCTPAELDFGSVNPQSCVEKIVTCANIANEVVTIVDWSEARDTNTSLDFQFEAFTSVFSLEEGDEREIKITYCPGELGPDTGSFEIETDNTRIDRRFAYVALTGTGGGPDIKVEPPVLDFGTVSLLAPSRRTLSIANLGYEELEVSEVLIDTLGTGAFTATVAGRIVPIGGFFDVTVEFQPLSEGPVTSEVLIRSTDQDDPEVRVILRGTGIMLPTCTYEIVPNPVNFGHVVRGRTNNRAVEIRNTGTVDCLITSARILNRSDSGFSLPDGNTHSIRITPGATKFVSVAFTPTELGSHNGFMEFSISSDTMPFNIVPLHGRGVQAGLLIVPRDIDFGTIAVGCAARQREITVFNTGTVPSNIDSIVIETPQGSPFSLSNLPSNNTSGPVVIGPGASMTFNVGFAANEISWYAGAVIINATYQGAAATYYISTIGRGDINAVQVDEFDQLGQPKVDMLMVVDNSGSMRRFQDSLANNFGAFIQFATTQNVDYQIAITTTDVSGAGASGQFVPLSAPSIERIIRPNSLPDPETRFRQNVNVGTQGSGTEQGMHAAYLALSNPLIFGHNAGFIRPDAVLSLIFVSDEDDHSPSSVDFYFNFFVSIKGYRNTNLFSVSSIVGDDPPGCGNVYPGPRYRSLANLTGGMFLPICTSDWSRSLQELSTNAFGLKSLFFLNNQPVQASMNVVVDGVSVPAREVDQTLNWEFDPEANSLNFSPYSTPEPGAHIRIEYSVQCL